ncbi:MAG: hypothetical protein ACM3U1_03750 [Chloroflexota bacterium]
MNWESIIEFTLNEGIYILMLLIIHFFVAESIWLRHKLGKNYQSAPDFLPGARRKSIILMAVAAALFAIVVLLHSRVGNVTYEFILRGLIFIGYLGFAVKSWRRMSYGSVLYYGDESFAVYRFGFMGSPLFNTQKWSNVEKAECMNDRNGRTCKIEFKNGKKPVIFRSLEGGNQEIENLLRERVELKESK